MHPWHDSLQSRDGLTTLRLLDKVVINLYDGRGSDDL